MEITYKSGAPEILWKPNLQRVYLFFGEEDRLKEEGIAAVTQHVVAPDFAEFDVEVLNAGSVSAEEIAAAAGQVPFASERRLVVVRGMEQWRDRNKHAETERLAEAIEKLPASTCLLLSAASEEEEAKRKTGVTVKLDNAVKKQGAVVVFRALRGEGLTDWMQERVRKERKRIESDAINKLVSAVGSELLVLEQELIKLICYVGNRAMITARDVAEVTSTGPEDVMFVTIDAIVRGQTDVALSLLNELHRYDPKAQAVAGKLLALLARQYRMLWQAKFLQEQSVSPRDVRALPPHITAELPADPSIAQIAFKATDLFAQSRTFRWSDLTEALDNLLMCDMANKGGPREEVGIYGSDPSSNLQLLVLQLTGAMRKAGGRAEVRSGRGT